MKNIEAAKIIEEMVRDKNRTTVLEEIALRKAVKVLRRYEQNKQG